ncbi:MAG: ATP-binding protein [archaeon]|nr:ATP-binding protein [archaeon]
MDNPNNYNPYSKDFNPNPNTGGYNPYKNNMGNYQNPYGGNFPQNQGQFNPQNRYQGQGQYGNFQGPYNNPYTQINFENNPQTQNPNMNQWNNNPYTQGGFNNTGRPMNPQGFNQPQQQPQKKSKEEIVQMMLSTCDKKYQDSLVLRSNGNFIDAMTNLEKISTKLEELKTMIVNQKHELSQFLPQVSDIISKTHQKILDFKNELYTFSNSSVFVYQPKSDQTTMPIYIKTLLVTPFVTKDDLYYERTDIFNESTNLWHRSLGTLRKAVLISGPKGAGKSLFAQFFAHDAKCKFLQIDNPELLEMPDFVKTLFMNMSAYEPLVIYIKKIENFVKKFSFLEYFLDKIQDDKNKNKKFYVILSTDFSLRLLPRDLMQRIVSRPLIFPMTFKKGDFVKFVCGKLKIKTNFSINEIEMMNNYIQFQWSNCQIYQALYELWMSKIQLASPDYEPNIAYSELIEKLGTVQPDWSTEYLQSFSSF